MNFLPENFVCAYLYVISKYGYPPPAKDIEKYMREMSQLGFRQIELEGIGSAHITQMYERRENIKLILDKLGISVPVYCTVLPKLSSMVPGQDYDEQRKLLEIGCQTARHIGANFLLDNGPLPPYSFDKKHAINRHYDLRILADARLPTGFSWSTFYGQLVEIFQDVCDICSQYGLTYLLHPATGVLCSTPESFLAFHRDVDRNNLGFNFDTANLIALKQNLSLALEMLIDHSPYIHLSDTGIHDHQHLPLGNGIIAWDTFFNELRRKKYDGLLGIDIGGAESGVRELDQAYLSAVDFITKRL